MSFIKMIGEKLKARKYDIIVVSAICTVSFILAYIAFGFWKTGVYVPLAYSGGDDFTTYAMAKIVGEGGWVFGCKDLGAPFGADYSTYYASCLNAFDLVVTKILYPFFKDPIATVNVRFLLIYPMCAFTAYFVLRALHLRKHFAAFGAMLFAFSPFIFYRGIAHIVLSACYFIPLSMLLCVWAFQEGEDYLRFDKGFFKNYKNVLTLIFALLIGTNGIGYYPIITCYLLVVVAGMKLLSAKKIKSVLPSAKSILFIFIFFLIPIIPSLFSILTSGEDVGAFTRRGPALEMHGLKIIQLFIPISGHELGFLQNLIDMYNSGMPLVNENIGSYLGIAGICGFLMGIIELLRHPDTENKQDVCVNTMAKLNLFSVLFGTVGGFGTMFGFVIGFLRGFNRISIFISFISIFILVYYAQYFWNKLKEKKDWKKYAVTVCFAVFTLVCVWDLRPSISVQESDKLKMESDKSFIAMMEDELPEGAMVYQLPYHAYPESGWVRNMVDYHLITGFIWSDDLQWSYGAVKGGSADSWYREVASIALPEQVDYVARAGFKAVYIDSRAYEPTALSEMLAELTSVIGNEPEFSADGNLIYYNLSGYIEKNAITADEKYLDLDYARAQLKSFYPAKELFCTDKGTLQNGSIVLGKDGIQYGPYFTVSAGNYEITFYGEGLDKAVLDCTAEKGAFEMPITLVSVDGGKAIYRVTFDRQYADVEFRATNPSGETVTVSKITSQKIQ